jgi:aspartate beta-hydroxylase
MTAKDALQFRLNWHSLQLAGALRGIGNRDLQRVKSYLRQRFDLEEPKWVAPYQRPKKMLAGLRSNPVYPSDAFPWVAELEAAHPAILDEYQRLTADTLRRHPQDLAVRGRWNVAYLYSRGRAVKKNADRCPKTLGALAKIPGAGVAGETYFSIMVPGTYVRPHCGPTNARIRCHLCLTEARDCWIRVGDRKYRWYAGRCLIFDDSFEHEVSHEGDTPRAVLITDFWHPDLTEAERWALGAMRESLRLASRYRRFVKKLQKAAGLRRGK